MIRRILSFIGIVLFIFLSLLLVKNALPYLSGSRDFAFLESKMELADNIIWRSSFYMHISGSILCLLTGILQFSRWIIIKKPIIHRILGQIYVLSVLLLAWPGGQFLSMYASGGIMARIPFFILSVLWGYSTYKGYVFIKKKDRLRHSSWMIRSYAYAATAVSFRTYFLLLEYFGDFDPVLCSIVGQWASLIGNALFAELIIRRCKVSYFKLTLEAK